MNKFLNSTIGFLNICLCYLLPVIPGTVLFDGDGEYDGNAKYVSEELHRKAPDIRIVWSAKRSLQDRFPEYAETVRPGSRELQTLMYRAACVVENSVGERVFRPNSRQSALKRRKELFKARKKRGQLDIALRHGTPLKKKYGDGVINGYVTEDLATSATYISAGSTFAERIYESSLYGKVPVKLYGNPRNDILFREADRAKLKEKLGLPADKKLVLYAPSYKATYENAIKSVYGRDENGHACGPDQLAALDIKALLDAMTEKFSGEWCLVFRTHPVLRRQGSRYVDVAAYERNDGGGHIVSGNRGEDMAEYLACADVLITDYSSSMFDFALTGRPCMLYAPDIFDYPNMDEALYIPYGDLPFPKAYSSEEMIRNVREFDTAEYKAGVDSLLEEMECIEDGKAAERICDDIIAHMKK